MSEKKSVQPPLFPDRKPVPVSHPKDDRYRTYCVDCGTLLLRYEAEWDGHRNEVGDCVERRPCEVAFKGTRCTGCHRRLFEWVEDYYNRSAGDAP